MEESKQLLLFPYKVSKSQATLIGAQEFSERYLLTWEYLLANRAALENREDGKMKHERWYAFVYPKNLALHDNPKIAIPRLVRALHAYYDSAPNYYLDNVDVGGLILKDPSDDNYKYVLALLNSKLLDWYFQQISASFRGGFRSANRQFIEPLPIRRIDTSETKGHYKSLVRLADQMLGLQARLSPVRNTPLAERDDLLREIERNDREIDEAVYNLYGLTKAERGIVEEAATKTPKAKGTNQTALFA